MIAKPLVLLYVSVILRRNTLSTDSHVNNTCLTESGPIFSGGGACGSEGGKEKAQVGGVGHLGNPHWSNFVPHKCVKCAWEQAPAKNLNTKNPSDISCLYRERQQQSQHGLSELAMPGLRSGASIYNRANSRAHTKTETTHLCGALEVCPLLAKNITTQNIKWTHSLFRCWSNMYQ